MRYQPRESDLSKQRTLRQSQTQAEEILWADLRKNWCNVKFRRQHRIHQFIIDFYAPALKLGIELDGRGHFSEEGKRFDALRTERLAELGIRIIRFENGAVIANPWHVLDEISKVIAGIRHPSPGR